MTTLTISPKFQIVIPKAIREMPGLRPGQKIQAILYEDRIELTPVRRMKDMRGLVLQQRGEPAGLQAVALMHQGRVVGLDAPLALEAARVSVAERLPLADSVMLATARAYRATLWTQDSDFEGREGVRYVFSPTSVSRKASRTS